MGQLRRTSEVTTWPSFTVPAALVASRPWEIHDNVLVFPYVDSEAFERKPLPHEWFSRVLPDLDADSFETYAEMALAIGPLVDPEAPLRHVPAWVNDGDLPNGEFSQVPFDVLRFHLRTAQALEKHWRLFKAGEDTMEAWEWYGQGAAVLGRDRQADFYFTGALNSALACFSPRVVIERTAPSAFSSGGLDFVPVYVAVCLQLWNHIAEGGELRECPHCRTRFYRQEGRSKRDQGRTTGVTYCSASCAWSASKKRTRARKRATDTAK
jgi:hypothetical protein